MEWVITLGLGFAGRLGGDIWHVGGKVVWRDQKRSKKWPGVAKNSSGLRAGLVQFYSGVVLAVTLGSGLLRVRDAPGDVGAQWATRGHDRLSTGVMVRRVGVDSPGVVVALAPHLLR